MSGRLLEAAPMMPAALWQHLGTQFAVAAPDLASLRVLYRRAPTWIEHQQLACEALGFRWLSEPQCRSLVRGLRRELTRTRDRERLLRFARRWLYDRQLIIVHERALRSIISSATRQYETALARSIHAQIDSDRLERWRQALLVPRQTVSARDNAGNVGSSSVVVTVPHVMPSSGHVGYTIITQWNPGLLAALSMDNAGSTPIACWTLTWTFGEGQTVTQLWNGAETQSGANVTAIDLGYNANIPPGGATRMWDFWLPGTMPPTRCRRDSR